MDFEALDGLIEQNLEHSLAELAELCAQPSVAAQNLGTEACAQLTAELLSRRGFQAEVIPTHGAPVVIGQRAGRADRTLLFYNHYDVQPPEPLELWTSPPFEPQVRDGHMFARGVSDDKGHIACRLAAIDALLALEGELPCSVKFIIEGEEEIGSLHLAEFVGQHKRRLAADACIWESGGVDYDGVPVQYAGLRGICYVELNVRTANRDAHSGLGGSIFPNAAWRLTWALNSLKGPDEHILIPGFYDRVIPPSARDLELLGQIPDRAEDHLRSYGLAGFIKGLRGGLELERESVFSPTCTICGLRSGYQGEGTKTVQPATAMAKVDFRLVPDQDPEEIVLLLRNHLDAAGFRDVEITYLGGEHPARTPVDHPFLQLALQSAAEVYGVEQRLVPMIGGSGPNYPFIHDLGLPVAMAGIGSPFDNVHAPDENISVENFVNGVRHTARIVARFAEQAG